MNTHAEKNDTSKTTVLIVDDSRRNQHALSLILKQAGYRIRTASNGPQALESIQAVLPDLILLDILMPNMNGYQVCKHLKADEQTRGVPIIFISALNETENKVKAFTVGGVDYITKPFQIEEVLARVKTHISLRELQKQLKTQLDEVQIRNEELDSFAHTVAHDLKSPLTSIILNLFSIQRKWRVMSEERMQRTIDDVVIDTRRLVRIIDELLLLASVRKEQVRASSLDMTDIVSKSLQPLENIVQEKQVEIILPESWPQSIGYAPWIEEVWANYINNAIKYGGSPPRVELGADYPFPVQSGEDEQPNVQARFWVRDNGRGLTLKERKRLFTPFERLDQISVKGYGLGLSIVRRIIEKLGGQVGVESEVGAGSTFWFTLPV
jgi:signal transduction histidine kinase